jgi:Trehalose utilisation
MTPLSPRSLRPRLTTTLLLPLLAYLAATTLFAADKKILLIAGPPSHGPGQHEHNAGVLLLQKCLASVKGVSTEVALNGWPKNPTAFAQVDAVIIFADGGARHIALQEDRLAVLGKVLGRGAGLGLLHYAVEPTLTKGQAEFIQWVGGAFEINWSINPHWDAQFTSFPTHPITRGVQPFMLRDEWYFHLRFSEAMKGVTPLLVATPDASTTKRPDGDHSGNPTVRAAVARGERQTVSWAYERPDGGRGFGLTGAHFHSNWSDANLRKLVLNAALWLAKIEVPANGVSSQVTPAELAANLDPKPQKKK